MKKIAIVSPPNLYQFIGHIARDLRNFYEIKFFYNENEIQTAVEWGDLIWFEFASHLAFSFAKNPRFQNLKKPVVCRLHGYEIREGLFSRINWSRFSELILVGERMVDFAQAITPNIEQQTKVSVIHNGVDLLKFNESNRLNMKEIAWVGNFYPVKNPQLALLILAELPEDYNLHFAVGKMGDPNIFLYMREMPEALGLGNRVFFDSQIPHEIMPAWLYDKGILLSTSLHESFSYAVAEGAAVGSFPLVHDFPVNGVEWPEEMLYKTVSQACAKIQGAQPNKFRNLIKEKYSYDDQFDKIKSLLENYLCDEE